MRRTMMVSILLLAFAVAFTATPAWAGPHFLSCNATVTGTNTLEVSGKEAGLGNTVTTATITCTATAECINGGGSHPKATNKISPSTTGPFPVRNGSVTFDETLTANFSPSCSPPMTVQWSNVTCTDINNNDSTSCPIK